MVHAALGVLLVAEALAVISLSLKEPAGSEQVVEVAAAWSRLPKAEESVPFVLSEPPKPAQPEKVEPKDATAVNKSELEDRIRNAISEADQLSAEEKLARLKELSGQLDRVSSDASLSALVQSMNKALGTAPRATKPAEVPVAGEFNFDSAQFHEVRREETADGFKYTAILLDAEGRTTLVEMSEEEGARMYQLMELIKSSPFMEKLYRGLMMGLIDKLSKPTNSESSNETKTAAETEKSESE